MPRNIYGVTKAAAENLAEIVHLEHGLPVIILRTSRFFPEPDDVAGVRDAYADANIKANEFLYRRADLQDVADAHLRATERAPRLGFGRYIISATTPFSPADLAGLGTDAPAVAHRLFPDLAAEYARRGWRMFPRIDRVLRQRAGPRRPGLGPALRLPLGAGPAAGRRGAAQPADPCRGRQGLPRRDHRRLHGSLTPAGLGPAPPGRCGQRSQGIALGTLPGSDGLPGAPAGGAGSPLTRRLLALFAMPFGTLAADARTLTL